MSPLGLRLLLARGLFVAVLVPLTGCGALDAAGVIGSARNADGEVMTLVVDGVVRRDADCAVEPTLRGHGTWDLSATSGYALEVQVSALRDAALAEVEVFAALTPEDLGRERAGVVTWRPANPVDLRTDDVFPAELPRLTEDAVRDALGADVRAQSGRDIWLTLQARDAAGVTSNARAFPVRVCVGCLRAGMTGDACTYADHAAHNAPTCVSGQDDVFQICAVSE